MNHKNQNKINRIKLPNKNVKIKTHIKRPRDKNEFYYKQLLILSFFIKI